MNIDSWDTDLAMDLMGYMSDIEFKQVAEFIDAFVERISYEDAKDWAERWHKLDKNTRKTVAVSYVGMKYTVFFLLAMEYLSILHLTGRLN